MKTSYYVFYLFLTTAVIFGAVYIVHFFTRTFPADELRKYPYTFQLIFRDGNGLYTGAKLRHRGVTCGIMEKIVLEKDHIRAIVRTDFIPAIYANYAIIAMPINAAGGRFLDIYPGDNTSPVLFSSLQGASLEARSIGDPLFSLAFTFDTRRKDIQTIFDNTRDITERIASGQGSMAKMINHDGIYSRLLTLSTSVRNLLTHADQVRAIYEQNSSRGDWNRQMNQVIKRELY